MIVRNSLLLSGAAALFVIVGCKAGTQWTKTPVNASASTPNAVSTPPPVAPPVSAPQAPYVLSAEAAGAYISFKLFNMGTTPLSVKKESFALLNPGDPSSRSVVPFDPHSTIIDIPQNAVIQPNGTLQGRALFKEFNNPVGKRLVFKPDDTGTFADIQPANSL